VYVAAVRTDFSGAMKGLENKSHRVGSEKTGDYRTESNEPWLGVKYVKYVGLSASRFRVSFC